MMYTKEDMCTIILNNNIVLIAVEVDDDMEKKWGYITWRETCG